MRRIARPVFAGTPHHITQRGNRREDVFFDEADRVAYLAWLGEYCAKYKVKVLAYCLALDDTYLWAAIRYVERYPARARRVRRAENYPWSSAATHCGL